MFAQSLGKTTISLYMLSGAAVIHFALVYLFVTLLGWGFTGICVATSLHFVVRFTISYSIINSWDGLKNTFPGEVQLFSKDTV